MPKWFLWQVLTIVGALGTYGAARAQDVGSSAFTSETQARAYLRDNPTGPMAKAAFVAMVEFQLARANPGFTRAEIAASFNRQDSRSAAAASHVARQADSREDGQGY